MVAVVAARNQSDVQALETLRQTFPQCQPVMVDTDKHDITSYFYRVRLVRLFYACLFDYWDQPAIRSGLFAILEQIALHSYSDESQRAERVLKLRQSLSDVRRKSAQQIDAIQERLERHHRRQLEAIRASGATAQGVIWEQILAVHKTAASSRKTCAAIHKIGKRRVALHAAPGQRDIPSTVTAHAPREVVAETLENKDCVSNKVSNF